MKRNHQSFLLFSVWDKGPFHPESSTVHEKNIKEQKRDEFSKVEVKFSVTCQVVIG